MDNNKLNKKEAYTTDNKKGVVPFSEVGKQPVKVRHVCDQSIARCNKNMIANMLDNKRERQQSMDAADQPRFGKAKILRK